MIYSKHSINHYYYHNHYYKEIRKLIVVKARDEEPWTRAEINKDGEEKSVQLFLSWTWLIGVGERER